MTSAHSHRLLYAIDSYGTIVYINDVANGLACNCKCPSCGEDLIAKNNGSIKDHHFAHASGADCKGARMTALHLLAQKVLQERKTVMLPPYEGGFLHHSAEVRTFDEIRLEEVCKTEDSTRRPDCIGVKNGKAETLWIEIFCTNKIADERKKDIQNRKQYCIEIDCSDLLESDYTQDDVTKRIEKDTRHREWICCPVWEEENKKRQNQYNENRKREAKRQKEEKQKIQQYNTRIEELAKDWKNEQTQELTQQVIREIRNYPYPKKVEDGHCSIVAYLITEKEGHLNYNMVQDWYKFAIDHPRSIGGKKVFYTLMPFYYKVNDDDVAILKDNINQLLHFARSPIEEIALEYMLIIWTLYQLYIYDIHNDTHFGKSLIIKQTIREQYINLIKQFGNLNVIYDNSLLKQTIEALGDSEELIKILHICNNPYQEVTTAKSVQYDYSPYGFDKELYGKDLKRLWEETNRKFNE